MTLVKFYYNDKKTSNIMERVPNMGEGVCIQFPGSDLLVYDIESICHVFGAGTKSNEHHVNIILKSNKYYDL